MEWKQVPVRLKRFAEQSLRAFAQLHHGKICRRVQRNFSLAGVGFALSHIHGFGDQIDVLPAKSPDLEMHRDPHVLPQPRRLCRCESRGSGGRARPKGGQGPLRERRVPRNSREWKVPVPEPARELVAKIRRYTEGQRSANEASGSV